MNRVRLIRNSLIAIIIFLFTFLTPLEIALQVGWLDVHRDPSRPARLDDPQLPYRVVPGSVGHDGRGWHNDIALASANIVSIGDSQTHGHHVAPSDAYPQQMGQILDRTVYNMALGGFGPVDFTFLIDEALELNPSLITIGLYTGNDLPDCHRSLVHGNFPAWRSESVAYDEDFQNPAAGLRQTARDLISNPNLVLPDTPEAIPVRPFNRNISNTSGAFSFKSRQFLWELYDEQFGTPKDDFRYYQDLAISIGQLETHFGKPSMLLAYDDEHLYTTFEPYFRFVVMDMSNPIVADGKRICNLAIQNIIGQCADAEITCLFIVIPTKEHVYKPYLEANDIILDGYFADLTRVENELIAEWGALLSENAQPYLDTSLALQAAASAGQTLYPIDDGHPNEAGYRVIAEAVAAVINNLDLGDS